MDTFFTVGAIFIAIGMVFTIWRYLPRLAIDFFVHHEDKKRHPHLSLNGEAIVKKAKVVPTSHRILKRN